MKPTTFTETRKKEKAAQKEVFAWLREHKSVRIKKIPDTKNLYYVNKRVVQFKMDYSAAETEKLFLETLHVYDNGREELGWMYQPMTNEFHLFYIQPNGRLLSVDSRKLVEKLSEWKKAFPTIKGGRTKHKGQEAYTTYGICVPLDLFLSFAQVYYTKGGPSIDGKNPNAVNFMEF